MLLNPMPLCCLGMQRDIQPRLQLRSREYICNFCYGGGCGRGGGCACGCRCIFCRKIIRKQPKTKPNSYQARQSIANRSTESCYNYVSSVSFDVKIPALASWGSDGTRASDGPRTHIGVELGRNSGRHRGGTRTELGQIVDIGQTSDGTRAELG